MTVYHCTKFGCIRFSSSEDTVQILLGNFNPHCDLDFEHKIQYFHIDSCVSDDQTRFGCKRTISSEKTVKTITFWLYVPCGLDLEDSNPVLLHNTPAHGDSPSYQLWLQKAEQFRSYLLHRA